MKSYEKFLRKIGINSTCNTAVAGKNAAIQAEEKSLVKVVTKETSGASLDAYNNTVEVYSKRRTLLMNKGLSIFHQLVGYLILLQPMPGIRSSDSHTSVHEFIDDPAAESYYSEEDLNCVMKRNLLKQDCCNRLCN